ncbi:D-glucuronyl C5-epimerase family protein [Planococcus rifietoensis]|uniref:D-glucuronyl C5-epimerase family protein n=1 Tax=Planococcus rifietoensis TaxID=200991 RepID=UPI00385075FC
MNIKELAKLGLSAVTPNYYIKFLKWRYFVINDLSIKDINQYDYTSTFPTFYDKPPKHYQRWLKSLKFDDTGIVMYQKDGKYYYNPVQIIQFGLSEYGYYMSTKNEKHYKNFFRIVDWIVTNQEEESGKWIYYFDFYVATSKETLKSPWSNAMAQGEAMSLLSRAYSLNPQEVYLNTAIKAMKPLDTEIENNGLKSFIFNMPMYEEYPTMTHSHVLNGFMFCLIGLHDLNQVSKNSKALELYNEGILTLIRILPLYDSEYTSYYDLGHITCPPHAPRGANKYDPIHVDLLQTLNVYEKSEILDFYAVKWSRGVLSKVRDIQKNKGTI